MAPVVRGALTLGISRGDALRQFWESIFSWHGITNVTGIYANRESSPPAPAPLLLLNSCNTTWGTRFTIGFPALPQPFFRRDESDASQILTRFPVRSLSDTLPLYEVPLSYAVRLSSNFPWGFRVRTLAKTNLLDGGMVDNTGIDTVYEVFRRLSESESGRSVMAQMASKGIFILEIDSGGKPRGKREHIPRSLDSWNHSRR